MIGNIDYKRKGINMQIIKSCCKYIFTFVLAVFVLLGTLVLIAMIPRSYIKANMEESAKYLCDGEVFDEIIEDISGSKYDHYADSILLAINYQYDNEKPITSVMWSSYYYNKYQNENVNLLDAVTNDREANEQYLRYWHGSNVIVRPLLVIFNIKQIYILNAILLVALITANIIILIRKKAYIPIVGLMAGLVGTSFWFVPFSLEYTWTFMLMLIILPVCILLAYNDKEDKLGLVFMLGGIFTNYLDFLTTETLTFTVPLLMTLWILQNRGKFENTKQMFLIAAKWIAAWTFGYIGMWLMKWIIASIVLGENVLPYIVPHVSERIGGDIGVGPIKYVFGAIWRNIQCLFPLEYGIIGTFIGIIIVLFIIYTGYVYHADNIDVKGLFPYIIVGMIPYVRYVVLLNHSYLHYFFTYRAQLATILAIVLLIDKLVDGRWPVGVNKRKTKP